MRLHDGRDDSTGKAKATDARGRSAMLSAVFILGICLGVVVAERLYIANQEADTPAAGLERVRSRKMELAAAGAAAASTVGATLDAGATATAANPALRRGKPRNALEALLRRVAPSGEVLVVISNMNLIYEQSLELWLDCVSRLDNTTNWLVVAIDEELADYCKERGINYYHRPVQIPATQKNTGSNHAISAMKYEILEEFLTLGWHTLLSDVDIVTLQNPFDHLYRDADIEGMSDGFDAETAYGSIYGVDDPSMGWSRYAQGYRHMAFNSGLFYVRASARTVALMARIAARLRKEKAWDQSVYNEEIFFLSHGEYASPGVLARAMDIHQFMNTKVLFKYLRHDVAAFKRVKPVMVHSNYHPDKTERMRGVIAHYIEGKAGALDKFPDGSE